MELARQIQAIGEILQEMGGELYLKAFRNKGIAALSLGQFRYLEIIARQPGITATELAAFFGVKKPTVTQVTMALLARGLVKKKTAAEDKRVSRLQVTPATREIFAFRNGMYRLFAERAAAILTEGQRRAYERLNDLVLRGFAAGGARPAHRGKGE
jgi:DNA-binding MarR family transcriptional regulator